MIHAMPHLMITSTQVMAPGQSTPTPSTCVVGVVPSVGVAPNVSLPSDPVVASLLVVPLALELASPSALVSARSFALASLLAVEVSV